MRIAHALLGGIIVLVVGSACAVQTDVRTGSATSTPGPTPGPQPARPAPRRSTAGIPTTSPSAVSSTPSTRSELKPVTPRELAYYRSLIVGEDDKIVLDPTKFNATDNILTQAHKERVAALEKHAASYDAAAMINAPVECETKIATVLNAEAEEPIRRDEDDNQYARRKSAASKATGMFRRSLSSPGEVTQEDLRYAFRLLTSQFVDPNSRPLGAAPPAKTRLQQEVDRIPEKERGVCAAKFLLVVNEYWKKHRVELDAQRAGAVAAKESEARKVVLDRRFAPLKRECAEGWRANSAKCAELPGLSDDERGLCASECKAGAQEGFKTAFSNALSVCVDEFERGTFRACELKKPSESTVSDEELANATADCKASCRTQGLEVRAQRRAASPSAGAKPGANDGQGLKQCLDACQRTVPSQDDAALVQSCIDECGRDSACVGMCRARKGGTRTDRCAMDCASKFGMP